MGLNCYHAIACLVVFAGGIGVALMHLLYAQEVRIVYASSGPAVPCTITDKGKLIAVKPSCGTDPNRLDTPYCYQQYTLYFEVHGAQHSQVIKMNEEAFLYNKYNKGDPCTAYGYEDEIYVVQRLKSANGLVLFGIIFIYIIIVIVLIGGVFFFIVDPHSRSQYNPLP